MFEGITGNLVVNNVELVDYLVDTINDFGAEVFAAVGKSEGGCGSGERGVGGGGGGGGIRRVALCGRLRAWRGARRGEL